MSVGKPSICFWKWIISIKWRNKLLIHNINLIGHRKSACCIQLLVFLEIWVIAPFWHWRTQVFPKGCCHHDLKAFFWNWLQKCTFKCYRKYEIKMTRILFKFIIYSFCEKTLKNGRVKSKIGNGLLVTWIFWVHIIIWDYFSSVFCIVPQKVLFLKYWSELATWKIVTIMQRW